MLYRVNRMIYLPSRYCKIEMSMDLEGKRVGAVGYHKVDLYANCFHIDFYGFFLLNAQRIYH